MTASIGILVHDSDIFRLTLFKNGNFVSSVDNMSRGKASMKGNAEQWKAMISDSYSLENLKEICNSKYTFAEDYIAKISKVINLNSEHSLIGYNYLKDVGLEDVTYLRFKHRQTVIETEEILEATKFQFVYYKGIFQKRIGEEDEIDVGIRNEGEASSGIQIIIKGPAIEDELIRPSYIKLVKNEEGSEIEYVGMYRNVISSKNEKLFVADFTDFKIPIGYKSPKPKNSKELKKILQKQYASGFKVKMGFIGLTKCKSQLSIFYLPLINPMKGQNSNYLDITIT